MFSVMCFFLSIILIHNQSIEGSEPLKLLIDPIEIKQEKSKISRTNSNDFYWKQCALCWNGVEHNDPYEFLIVYEKKNKASEYVICHSYHPTCLQQCWDSNKEPCYDLCKDNRQKQLICIFCNKEITYQNLTEDCKKLATLKCSLDHACHRSCLENYLKAQEEKNQDAKCPRCNEIIRGRTPPSSMRIEFPITRLVLKEEFQPKENVREKVQSPKINKKKNIKEHLNHLMTEASYAFLVSFVIRELWESKLLTHKKPIKRLTSWALLGLGWWSTNELLTKNYPKRFENNPYVLAMWALGTGLGGYALPIYTSRKRGQL